MNFLILNLCIFYDSIIYFLKKCLFFFILLYQILHYTVINKNIHYNCHQTLTTSYNTYKRWFFLRINNTNCILKR